MRTGVVLAVLPKASGVRQLVVISGASGSGKSTALRSLEDLGFYCMDNVPAILIESVLSLCDGNDEVEDVAIGVDARSGPFLENVASVLDGLGDRWPLRIIWLDAQDKVLAKRYQMTGRSHPLGDDLFNAVAVERDLLDDVRSRATDRLDTSGMSPHDLKGAVQSLVATENERNYTVRIKSFGFRHGIPSDVDHVFDVRFLPNPYWDEKLRPYSGCHPKIQRFMEEQPEVERYLGFITTFLRRVLRLSRKAGKQNLSVGIGCTGGQHRSVYISEHLHSSLVGDGHSTHISHRDKSEE
ncbi:MAG: RNase adapter RapZ [Myxococcales bacterium]|nr:RNase adapter RapZ [Myxococcales bacterium]